MAEVNNETPMEAAASRLTEIFVNRFSKEQLARHLSNRELEGIWFTLLGMLSCGQTEQELEEYCLNVPISKSKSIHE